MSVFETDNYKMAKSEASQSTDAYTSFSDSQFNYINDINSGVYSSNPTLVQFDLSTIYNSSAFLNVEDLYLAIPITMVAQYVTGAGVGVVPPSGSSSSLLTMKNSYQSLVHQVEMSVNGKVVNDLQPFQNIYSGFRLASTMNAGSDVKQQAMTLGISDTGLDNPTSVIFSSNLNPLSAGASALYGGGLTNNRPFQSIGVVGTPLQPVNGPQGTSCINDAINRKASRMVDSTGTVATGSAGIFGTSGGQGTSTLTIMSASQLNTEFKPYYTVLNSTYMVWYDVAILPLKYLMNVCEKLPMMKRCDALLRIYLNTGSMIIPVATPNTTTLAYGQPQSSSFVNTCPYTINWLGGVASGNSTGVPATTVGIASGIFIGKATSTSLSLTAGPALSVFLTSVTTSSVNLSLSGASHPMPACRAYYNQIKLEPSKELMYLESNRAKKVVYEKMIYNQYNGITSGSNFSQLISSGVKNVLGCLVVPFISTQNTGFIVGGTAPLVAQYSSPFDTCGGISFAPLSLTNLQVSVGGTTQLQNPLFYTYENFITQVCEYESVAGANINLFSQGIFSQQWWEANRVYWVNCSRGKEADKAMPRNVQVSLTNNTNVTIDLMVFVVYLDSITVDVASGLISQ